MKKILPFLIAFLFTTTTFAQSFPFTGKPTYQIMTERAGVYLGTTTIELFPAIALNHVKNFDSLVSTQFYDSTAFHRVIPGFMIQGGDPNSINGPASTWGLGDSTQPTVNAEFSAAKRLRGTLSAARDTDINSANSQFFICVAPAAWLNGAYSVYGHVTSGMDIVDSIVASPRDSVDNPFQKIEMFITYTGSNDSIPVSPVLNLPLSGSYSASTVRALKWFAVSDAIIYHVEVSTDSLFSTFFKSVDVGTNQYTVTGLSAGTTYYWRVFTNNGGNVSSFSDVWNFYVSATGIEEITTAPTILVSPNPGRGRFLFSNLEKGNNMEIFDITGRMILSLVSNSTSHTIDLTGKENGIYFYRISMKNKVLGNGKLLLQSE